jgi:branched-chain amino acid aminotransferase
VRFWVSGGLVPAEEARVGVLDHGFTVGDGVFETMKTLTVPTLGVVPFAMDLHIARLATSARGMGLEAPGAEEVRDALLAVCAANPELEAGGRLRVTYTSGPGPLGSDRMAGGATMTVVASPPVTWPRTTVLALSPWPRNESSPLAGLKSTSYGENVLALARARSVGAGEALLANLAGNLCEGTGSNVFLVNEDRVLTPPVSSGCLAGITRGLVLQWCADAGLEVEERDIPRAEVRDADEVFITSSTRDVHPVTDVLDAEGGTVWSGGAGPLTRQIAQVFAERSEADWNPKVRA